MPDHLVREGKPSKTAAYVATWRALGDCLPPEVRLCHDPLGWAFSPPEVAWLRAIVRRFPGASWSALRRTPLRRLLLWMQLRTRAIDDLAIEFTRNGGRQIVLLGAGFDSRAVRLRGRLPDVKFFEVDHPATQARKGALLDANHTPANASLLAWDFERDPLAELPSKLEERGLVPVEPTLTIWEGVIPYLTERAIEDTLAAVRRFGSKDSRVLLHYIERRNVEKRTAWHAAAASVGEPMRFGWEPSELPEWLNARGWELLGDRDDIALARELFGKAWTFGGAGGRIAVAKPGRPRPL